MGANTFYIEEGAYVNAVANTTTVMYELTFAQLTEIAKDHPILEKNFLKYQTKGMNIKNTNPIDILKPIQR